MIKTGLASCERGTLTRAEGVHVLVELEAHHGAIVVNDVGLAVPGTRHHLLSAVPLQTNTGKRETCCCQSHTNFQKGFSVINTEIKDYFPVTRLHPRRTSPFEI